MNYLKKFGLSFLAIAFCLSFSVISADAQKRNRNWNRSDNNRWERQDGNRRNRSWQNRSWQNRNRQNVYWQQNRSYRYGRITPQEYWQMQRRRALLNRTRSRYYNDGYLSNKERRKLQKRYNKYQRRVYRDRRDW